MITSKSGQTADTATYIHGCFIVRVGSQFQTFQQIMQYAQQDEIFGTTTAPALDSNVSTALSSVGDDSTSTSYAMPVYFAKSKCRDTSMGGNDAINPLPQFSLDDDIVHPHFIPTYGTSEGMGQVYSENFDDTQQILYLGFGIPLFSNVASFWGNAVDQYMPGYMNQGGGITSENIGYLIGTAPVRILSIATIPFKWIRAMTDTLATVPITKYYAFSSQMPMYFRFVNVILVMLATNMNLMGSQTDYVGTGSDTSSTTPLGLLDTTSGGDLSGMATIFKTFGIDMAQIMTKRYLYENGGSNTTITNRWTDDAMYKAAALNGGTGTATPSTAATTSTNPTANTTNANGTSTSGTTTDGTSTDGQARFWQLSWFDGFKAAYSDAFYDGHMFIGFRIDEGSGASESFSNATGESQISQAANAKLQDATNLSFSSMGGDFGGSGVMGAISDVISGVGGVLKGAAAAFKMDPLAAAASGSVRVDIPDVWMGSTYSRSTSFSISCLSPYGDMESIFQSEYVPLACILAGTLPRSTGYASHASPFICQAYCRGIFASPLAMIESLEITRGADQFGFTANRLPLKVQMHITLKDLTPTMYLQMGGQNGIAQALLGADDSFGEYMMTLAGMGLRDRLAPFRNLRRKAQILLGTVYANKLSPYMLGMEGASRFTISRMISTVVAGGKALPGN